MVQQAHVMQIKLQWEGQQYKVGNSYRELFINLLEQCWSHSTYNTFSGHKIIYNTLTG